MSNKNIFLVIMSLSIMGAFIYTQSKKLDQKESAPPIAEPSDQTTSAANSAPSTDYEMNKDKLVSGEPAPLQPTEVQSSDAAEISALAQKPVMDLVPNLNDYKNEIAKKPQGAPPSLKKFNIVMDEKLKIALKDQTASRDLLPELGECVKRAGVTFAQQVCLINAKKIQKQYPDLTPEVSAIEKSASPDVKKRAKIMGF